MQTFDQSRPPVSDSIETYIYFLSKPDLSGDLIKTKTDSGWHLPYLKQLLNPSIYIYCLSYSIKLYADLKMFDSGTSLFKYHLSSLRWFV